MKNVSLPHLPMRSRVETPDHEPQMPPRSSGKAPTHIQIIRIDPYKRSIAKIKFKCGRNAVPEVKRILRAQTVGHQELQRVLLSGNEAPLIVAAGLDIEKTEPGWRLRGGEVTVGISMLFGKGAGGGMIDVPVDVEWVKRSIVWVEGEPEDAGAA